MEEMDHPRPIVVVSECLGFGAVRYNGQLLRSRFVEALREHVEFIRTCPEVGIGLGVPRDPVRLVDDDGRPRLVQPDTDRDVTQEMETFSQEFLSSVGPVDGFILKGRSPTCGVFDARVYSGQENAPVSGKGPGLFARHVLDVFPLAAIEDEGRLTNLRLRDHFLTKLFTVARFRAARAEGRARALVRFHTEHKLLLMAQSPDALRRLGRTVGRAGSGALDEVFETYAETLQEALAKPPRPGPVVNVLQHALGHLSDALKPRERAYFLELLEEYRNERIPLAALHSVLGAWVARHGEPYLELQRFFAPYPRALLELTDSGLRSRVR